jgi:hypothetical protein
VVQDGDPEAGAGGGGALAGDAGPLAWPPAGVRLPRSCVWTASFAGRGVLLANVRRSSSGEEIVMSDLVHVLMVEDDPGDPLMVRKSFA